MFTHKLSVVTADYRVADTPVRLPPDVVVEQHLHGHDDSW
jgi:hypothetical protein